MAEERGGLRAQSAAHRAERRASAAFSAAGPLPLEALAAAGAPHDARVTHLSIGGSAGGYGAPISFITHAPGAAPSPCCTVSDARHSRLDYALGSAVAIERALGA